MTYLIAALSFVWSLRIIGNVLSFTHLWWVKEYRWDRMFVHLGTSQGKGIYFMPWKRPRRSPKSVLLAATTLAVLSGFVLLSGLPYLAGLFVADLMSFPVTFIAVGLLYIPTYLYHTYVIRRARIMLRAHPPRMVIGITGSYGKTSTKEYSAAILSSQYKTFKTDASKNAPIGISEVVVSKMREDYDVFVVEMGAYKKGEVAFMADLVRPQIAVITAINAQHQDLFGSIENTMRAKYELVAGLTGKRIAIFNADDARVVTMAGWAGKDGIDVWWYTRGNADALRGTVCSAEHIRADLSGVRFDAVMGKDRVGVSVPVVGVHQVSNILAAIAAAVASGMTLRDAGKAAARLRPASHVLEPVAGKNGMRLIDDTFNNNPDAARAALDVLAMQKDGKHYFVFQPMIELGAYASSSHRAVGEAAARVCDGIILTNENWANDFIEGVRSVSKTVPVSVHSGRAAAEYLLKTAPRGSAVLFKGKEAWGVLKELAIHVGGGAHV